jgi:hypothetical protein
MKKGMMHEFLSDACARTRLNVDLHRPPHTSPTHPSLPLMNEPEYRSWTRRIPMPCVPGPGSCRAGTAFVPLDEYITDTERRCFARRTSTSTNRPLPRAHHARRTRPPRSRRVVPSGAGFTSLLRMVVPLGMRIWGQAHQRGLRAGHPQVRVLQRPGTGGVHVFERAYTPLAVTSCSADMHRS